MTQKFYKVVKSIKGKKRGLVSARSVSLANYNNSSHIVHYRTQRWVKPKIANSKLFVFSSLKDARNFRCSCNEHIYECEVKNPERSFRIAYLNSDIPKFWDKCSLSMPTTSPPKNTYFCDAVKLIKRIC